MGFVHVITCLDSDSYSGVVPYLMVSSFKGIGSACSMTIVILMVRSWVTIVDSGKAQVEPRWCALSGKFSIFWIFFGEVVFSFVESLVGPSAGHGGFDGTMNAIKSMMMAFVLLYYFGLCFHYARKISKAIGAGGSGNDATKVIKKYCRICMFGMSMGLLFKFGMTATRVGKTIWVPPPCAGKTVDPVSIIYFFVQFGIPLALNPCKSKKATSKVASSTTSSTS